MRMRKKKNGARRLEAVSHLFCTPPDTPITDGRAHFGNDREIRLEIGCGKGGFACGMASKYPEANFYALERVSDVILLAAERAERERDARPTDNLRFLLAGAGDLSACFAPASLSVIYLNFSDPWPKKGHAKRRLTHRDFLRGYLRLLKMGGELRFKTDNVGLFDFTLEELDALGLTPYFVTRDLHNSPENEGNVMTEYEKNFSEKGFPIHSLALRKSFELPDTPTEQAPAESPVEDIPSADTPAAE